MKFKVKNVSVNEDEDAWDDHHTTFLAFGTEKNVILPNPRTMCGCCNGMQACSHSLAFMLFIKCVQRCGYDQHTFESKISENPIKLQNSLTLIEHVVNNEFLKVSKKRKTIENELT